MRGAMSFRVRSVRGVERPIDLAAVGGPVGDAAEPPIVLVTWQDAWADSEQHERAEWRSDYLVRTTGFLVRDDPDVVSVAQEILPEEDGFRAVTHIPRGMIASIRDIRDDRDGRRSSRPSR